MANWVKFLIFIAVVIMTVFVLSANFAFLAGFLLLSIVGIIIGSAVNENFGGWVGEILNATGRHNNLRLYALAGLTLLTLILAIKHEAGEPIFATATREITEAVSPHYDGTTANTILYGKPVGNKVLERRRANIGASTSAQFQPQSRGAGESSESYNGKIANYLSQGAFGTDTEVESIRYAPADHRPQRSLFAQWMADSGRTWFYWQLFFVLLVMTVLYAPFAFRDEAIRFIDNRLETLSAMVDAKERSGVTPTPTATASGPSAVTNLARIIGIDAVMEFIYAAFKRLLEAH